MLQHLSKEYSEEVMRQLTVLCRIGPGRPSLKVIVANGYALQVFKMGVLETRRADKSGRGTEGRWHGTSYAGITK